MSKITYQIVQHDGGWAYRAEGTYSETFPTHEAARQAVLRVAREQAQPGESTAISWEDSEGHWHNETAAGTDRPDIDVQDPSMNTFDLAPPTPEQRRKITQSLSADERRVLLEHGTEAAFCGAFLDNKKHGVYTCRFCGLPLFRSDAKFDSGTGWPSFFRPYAEAHIRRVRDISYGMIRTEEVCARCGSHLGHVFPDGPPPTGERHCLNSVSMSFTEVGHVLPDVLGRGSPEGQPDAQI